MSFTKLFSSITESTVWCESDQVRIVWITMLAMANQNGKVFGSIPGLANRARVPIEAVEEALKKFMAPDPYSRTKDFEGRRIEEVDGGWKLLTYEKHSAYRHEDERREYQREWVRKRRLSTNVDYLSTNVDRSRPASTHADADADTYTDKEKTKSKAKTSAFAPPSLEEVKAYCEERKSPVDPAKFHDYYSSQGWYVGSHRMKDWRAAVRNWERKSFGMEFRGGYEQPKSAAQLRNERNAKAVEQALRELNEVRDTPPEGA